MKRWAEAAKQRVLVTWGPSKSSYSRLTKWRCNVKALLGHGVWLDGYSGTSSSCIPPSLPFPIPHVSSEDVTNQERHPPGRTASSCNESQYQTRGGDVARTNAISDVGNISSSVSLLLQLPKIKITDSQSGQQPYRMIEGRNRMKERRLNNQRHPLPIPVRLPSIINCNSSLESSTVK